MDKVIFPDFYDEEDKANYHDMISRGQALLGKQIPHKDQFLLDLSARMTINQIKGYQDEKTDVEVKEQQQKHKDAQKEAHIITPDDLYEPGQHPLELNQFIANKEHETEEAGAEVTEVTEVTEVNLIS
jgi:hypothetical protein